MTYFEINKFVTNEVLPEINDIVKEYLESTYSYIENTEDLEDLEYAEITDELFNDVKKDIISLIKESENDYDFTKVNDKEINDDLLYQLIDSSFADYKEILLNKYNEEFDREEYIDEYYSDIEF